jgi:hypothetical protein
LNRGRGPALVFLVLLGVGHRDRGDDIAARHENLLIYLLHSTHQLLMIL